MSDNVNPYAAPLDSPSGPRGPAAKDMIVDRLSFDGQVTFQHHVDAVRRIGIRSDARSTRSVATSLSVVLLAGLGISVLMFRGVINIPMTLLGILFYIAAITAFVTNQRRILFDVVPSIQTLTGHVRGYVDHEGIWVESENETRFHPISAMVSSACSHGIWVISFFRQQFQWITLPIDHFSDPVLARSVASDLTHYFPPVKPEVIDSRRWAKPDQEPRFTAEGEHVQFEGPFYEESLRGTLAGAWAISVARRTNLSISLMFIFLAVGSILIFQLNITVAFLALLYFGMIFAFAMLMIWRKKRKAMRDDGTLLYDCKGWIDSNGYFNMTAIGQGYAKWSLFDHFEINDNVIALYPHPVHQMAYCSARDQFANDADWDRACQIVRRGMSANGKLQQ